MATKVGKRQVPSLSLSLSLSRSRVCVCVHPSLYFSRLFARSHCYYWIHSFARIGGFLSVSLSLFLSLS
jgi:hypothetical protein